MDILSLPIINNDERGTDILSISISSSFQKKIPKIGVNKKLKKVLLSKKDSVIQEKNEPTQTKESNEQNSLKIFEKYKNQECLIVYSDNPEEKNRINTKISFSELVEIIQHDFSVVENFIDSSKGEWVSENKPNYIDDISFDSMFEEGNLRMAIKVNENEYDLIMRKDYNNEKNYSWFFFEVYSKIEREIKFNIINFPKKKLLFSNKARILTYNHLDNWSRNTYNVFYFQNCIPMPVNLVDNTNNLKEDEDGDKENKEVTLPPPQFYTTLTFTYRITKKLLNIPIYFSYCFPYTYTQLQNYLYELSTNEITKSLVKFSTLNNTICGNPLDILFISNWNIPEENKSSICLTARVHPGESNSSYVIEGVIDSLLRPESEELREKYIFKIIPMLNPDGVINGNYRNNILGRDLNRTWNDPRTTICPTIYYAKQIINQSNPAFYCDFHGHSSVSNCCLYGCSQNSKTSKISKKKQYRFNEERVFMKIFEKFSSFYNKQSSRYTISKAKLRTARAVVYNEILISMSYCLETSTISTCKDEIIEGFTIDKYYTVGKDFVNSLLRWNNKENFFLTLKKVRIELEEKKKKRAMKKKSSSDPSDKGKVSRIKNRKQLTIGETNNYSLMTIQNVNLKNGLTIKNNRDKYKRAESEGKKIIFKKLFFDK